MAQQNKDGQRQVPFDPFMMWGPPMGEPPQMPPMMQPPGQQMTNQTQNQGVPHFMTGFLDNNGQFDFNKMMDGANKVYNIYNQTQPMLKQLGSMLNMFKK